MAKKVRLDHVKKFFYFIDEQYLMTEFMEFGSALEFVKLNEISKLDLLLM
jgi:hypothetical protein